MIIISFYKVSTKNPGEVPDNFIWKVEFPYDLSDYQKSEFLSILFERREEILIANNNFISKNNADVPDTSDCKFCKKDFYLK